MKQYPIPILFIIFRRKDVALRSFERIKSIKPSKLYIACDGPRNNVEGEKKLVEATREAILNQVDWDCKVKTLFQKENLGCSLGVYTAINWLFENEEHGIILEDDCVVQCSFFPFVKELLEKYKDDERIGMIAGTNQIAKKCKMTSSYCFSKYAACWGWATWKRAWANMDLNMLFLKKHKNDVLSSRGYHAKENRRWNYQLKMIKHNYVSAWDWQWYFSLASQNQLCIFPKVNLVSNIGNDKEATHTGMGNIYIESKDIDFPIIHPYYIMPNECFDKEFYRADNTFIKKIKRYIPYNVKKILKKIIATLK